jgi:DNA-binding transcriptional regulator YiaG
MTETKWYGMHQRDNRIWLKRFMKHFELTRPQVANHLGVNVSTVDRWLTPEGSSSHRNMPAMARKLLHCMVKTEVIEKRG